MGDTKTLFVLKHIFVFVIPGLCFKNFMCVLHNSTHPLGASNTRKRGHTRKTQKTTQHLNMAEQGLHYLCAM